jgi:catechol 2,3-dioxygenase-like lactoylglutathione lyase family enzyme
MSSAVRTPVQIAWVTADLDATERTLTDLLGARKWVRMPAVHFGPDTCTYRGRPADFRADISLSYAGEMQLELIAPVSGESIYTEYLRDSGPGLHHIAIEADGAEELAKAVEQRGVMPGAWSSPTSRRSPLASRIWRSRTSRRRSGRFSTT